MAGSTDSSGTLPAVLAGATAALVGAAVWAVLQTVTGYEIGYAAVGVGLLVGVVVGRLGRSAATGPLPVVAAVLAVLATVLGDLAGFAGLVGRTVEDAGYAAPGLLAVVSHVLSGSELVTDEYGLDVRGLWVDELSPVVALFLVLAAAAAYRTCRGLLTDADHARRAPEAFPPPAGPAYGPPAGPAPSV